MIRVLRYRTKSAAEAACSRIANRMGLPAGGTERWADPEKIEGGGWWIERPSRAEHDDDKGDRRRFKRRWRKEVDP